MGVGAALSPFALVFSEGAEAGGHDDEEDRRHPPFEWS